MIRLPFRFLEFAAAALAGLTLAAVTPAQGFPVLDSAPSANNAEVTFSLEYPTPPPSGEIWAMVVCYVNIIEDGGDWSKLIRAATGAVNETEGDNTGNAWASQIAGVNATAPLGGDSYTIPPSIVAEAVAEIRWQNDYASYARAFPASMAWPTTGWPANSTSTMDWSGLASSSGSTFDMAKVMRACLLRQIGYVMNKPVTHSDVISQVDAVMSMKDAGKAGFELSAVIVQLANGPGDPPTTPSIKLSRTKKITIQTAGSGGGAEAYFHFDYIYPVYAGSVLLVETVWSVPPPEGDYVFFLPTSAGMVSVPATLVEGPYSMGFQCDVPMNIQTGEFAIFNSTTLEYVEMTGLNNTSTLTNWVYYTPYSPI